MKTDPRKLVHHAVLHAATSPLSGAASTATYEHEVCSSDGRVLVRIKNTGGKPDTLRWSTQDELTD
jgi:hypothetical protein